MSSARLQVTLHDLYDYSIAEILVGFEGGESVRVAFYQNPSHEYEVFAQNFKFAYEYTSQLYQWNVSRFRKLIDTVKTVFHKKYKEEKISQIEQILFLKPIQTRLFELSRSNLYDEAKRYAEEVCDEYNCKKYKLVLMKE